MSKATNQNQVKRYNRRQFLKQVGLGGLGVAGVSILGACAPAVTQTQVVKETVEVEKIVEVEKVVEVEAQSPWITGLVPSDLDVTFNYSSWEGEGEMRKWLLHFDNFFTKFYPNVNVQGDWGIPWGDYWTKMPTQLAAGAVIDMMWMHDTRAPSFANNGWLMPMDELLNAYTPPDWPDKFYKSQVESFQWEGKQYGIPYDFAPGGFYVNLDLLEEAGVDVPTEDWDMNDLLEAAIALTKDKDGDGEIDQWGVFLPTTWSAGFYWIVKNFGGDFWDEAITESKFNQPETIEAFQYVTDLLWKHQVMPSADLLQGIGLGAGTAFAEGLIGIYWTLNDEALFLSEVVGDKFRWTTAPSPKGPAGRFQFVGGSAFSIPVTSSQPELAYELIRWTLTNPDNLKISGAMGSQFTGHVDFYEYGLPIPETGLDPEDFKHAMYDLGKRDGIHPVYHPKFLEWEPSVYQTVFDRLWIGEELDAAIACQEAHELTNELLQS